MSMFREAPIDGKPGPVSMRRVLAAFFTSAAVFLFYAAFTHSNAGWFVFIPGIVCVAAAVLFMFFTTWADIAQVGKAIKGE
jgi:hypothetical protein